MDIFLADLTLLGGNLRLSTLTVKTPTFLALVTEKIDRQSSAKLKNQSRIWQSNKTSPDTRQHLGKPIHRTCS